MSDGPEGSAVSVTQTDPVSAAQQRAAHAYADQLLAPEVAGPAADDALNAFRQTLASGTAGAAGSPAADDTLLALTRLMTAVSMPDRSSPEDRRQAVWASIGSASHCTCREAAALLATRANANIQPRESEALDEHLATCAECRELSARLVVADRAFRAALIPASRGLNVPGLPGGPRAAAALLAVLVAVGGGIVALASGSGSPRAHAGTVAGHTQTAEAVALTVPAGASTSPTTSLRTRAGIGPGTRVAVHHRAKARLAERHRAVHASTRSHTVTQTTPAASAPTTTSATSIAASDASAPTQPTSTPSSTPTAAANAGTTAGSGASSTSGASTPSTAAQVSGPSSLPADSAPQQGIGSVTSTTP
jgi:hypothetical protein